MASSCFSGLVPSNCLAVETLTIAPALFLLMVLGNFATTDWGNIAAGFLLVALALGVLVGFAEEIVCRGVLLVGLRGTFKEVMNKALNQTLSRTLITSGTVFLATMALYLFGGGVINDFAFTFLAGIVTGTYSSIYIASALVLWWYKGQRPMAAGAAQMGGQSAAAGAAPARI